MMTQRIVTLLMFVCACQVGFSQANNNNVSTAMPGRADQATSSKAARATFEMDGVTGFMLFKPHQQNSNTNNKPNPIVIEYELRNLKGNNQLYHVHVKPVPPFKPEEIKNKPGAIGDLCNEPATGGHLNPFNIKEKLSPKSAPLDKYELGDLSGKFGPMLKVSGDQDLYKGSFVDPTLELDGPNGIVGRSIVIHKSDGGKRWVCASIVAI